MEETKLSNYQKELLIDSLLNEKQHKLCYFINKQPDIETKKRVLQLYNTKKLKF
jgi:hypothetical protein